MDGAGLNTGNTNVTLAMGSPGSTKQDAMGVPRPMFLGYPVVISQAMANATAASKTICYFGDLSMAASMGVRRDISIDASPHRYFEYRQIGIQGVERFDIVNHDLGNTSTAGPIVALDTSAS